MKGQAVSIISVAIFFIMIGAILTGPTEWMTTALSDDDDDVDDINVLREDDNEDDAERHCDANTAGGGGWFMADGFKNTFGFYLNCSDLGNSSFVFHARSSSMAVHSLNFTKITFEDDDADGNWTAHAYGIASVKRVGNFSFHLKVTDCGKGCADEIDLWIESDGITYHWGADGLGGGNIWIKTCE